MPCVLFKEISYFWPIIELMGRILGIDYGTKRIGLAVTDPLQIFASPLKTVRNHEFYDFLKNLLETESVDEFVIGYPVTLNNKPSESVKYIKQFIKKLEKSYPGKQINLVDERFTSGMALKTMIEGGVGKKKRQDKAMVDKISASIILQSFLDKRQMAEGREQKEEGK
jgi:putative holliday junction resolvase